MSEAIIVALIVGTPVLLASIISTFAIRSSKGKELEQDSAALSVETLRILVTAQQGQIEQLNNRDARLTADNDRLREELLAHGQHVEALQGPDELDALLIEDQDRDAALTTTILMQHPGITRVIRRRSVADSVGVNAHVVITDLGLPESSGMDTLDAVLAAHPGVPVLVLTDLSDVGEEARRRGAVDYVHKPWRINDTLLAEKVLKARNARVT